MKRARVALLVASTSLHAQTVFNWDGNGDANDSGSWTTSNLWKPDGNVALTGNAAGDTFAMQIGGSTGGTFDSLTMNAGSFALTNTLDTLTLSLVNSFTPTSSFSIALLNFTNGATKTGAFDTITGLGAVTASSAVDVTSVLGTFATGDSWTFNNDSSTANFGALTYSVPEPSSWMLLILGAGVIIIRRRRHLSFR